jgi:hypothetical protein
MVSSSQEWTLQGKPHKPLRFDDLNIPQPNPPLIETVEELAVPQMEQDEPAQVAQLMETTVLQRST